MEMKDGVHNWIRMSNGSRIEWIERECLLFVHLYEITSEILEIRVKLPAIRHR